ncbi:hypothetical protein K469DRAFT_700353 [Zopfia rhizophila CBS 207.26]|uniref:Uncharacterized protein n=1 Tax=Zopfia rhizophila CBS 207.26 TaxID=1314779 RepID=A0A6A6DDC2_9PEZI|nr:hypothetical protein K469DRAFT_700353 [Zopfia rhizophila CBS 207.26]
MFELESVRKRLEAYFPGWGRTRWGELFSSALRHENFEEVNNVWTRNRDMRKDIANLICALLELLQCTGEQGGNLVAAYFSTVNTERQVMFDLHDNEWARCLRDSDRTATYAVVGDACLKLRARGNPAASCHPYEPHATLFQTGIVFGERIPVYADFVQLEPSEEMFRVNRMGSRTITLSPIDGQTAIRMLRLNVVTATEVIEDFNTAPEGVYDAIIRAGRVSIGGMKARRQLLLQQPQRRPERREHRRAGRSRRSPTEKPSKTHKCTIL